MLSVDKINKLEYYNNKMILKRIIARGGDIVEIDEEGHLRRWGSGEARMTAISVIGKDGQETKELSPEDPFTVHIEYTAKKELTNAVVGLAIYRGDGALVYGTNTLIDTSSPLTLKEQGTIDLIIDSLPVTNGDYTFDLAIHRPDGFNYDFRRDVCTLHIAGRTQTPGEIALPHRWEIR